MGDSRFTPPLDLDPPKGKEAEWALLRLAEMCGVERKHQTWSELADAISEAMRCQVCDEDYENRRDAEDAASRFV